MYKAVFIDIDGTLIKSDHSVSEETRNVINKLKEKNVVIILVSARPLHGIMPICKMVGLSEFPIASLNGSYITQDEKVIFESAIHFSLINKIENFLVDYKPTVIYYQQMQWFTEVNNSFVIKEQKITQTPIIVQPLQQTIEEWTINNTGPNKILIISGAEIINKIQTDLIAEFNNELNISTSKPTYLELMNKNASKENAVRFISNYYKIDMEDVIAIGDNFNDKEMIRIAGTGIAMGNAPNEVKSVADYITDTNNNDGVAKALIKFFDL